ncbi:hypothetical protein [Nostoc sp.]
MSVTHKVSTGIKRRYFLLTTGSVTDVNVAHSDRHLCDVIGKN